jgi:hypothetical protein
VREGYRHARMIPDLLRENGTGDTDHYLAV